MKKSDLIKKISESSSASKAEVEKIVSAVFDTITDELVAGGEVYISGFGKFYVRTVAERKIHNPRTGEESIAPAHKLAAFRNFTALKAAVNREQTA